MRAVLAFMVIAYRLLLAPLHAAIGNPAVLGGLFLCLLAAASLGLRGALATIAVVVVIDRGVALEQTGPETDWLCRSGDCTAGQAAVGGRLGSRDRFAPTLCSTQRTAAS